MNAAFKLPKSDRRRECPGEQLGRILKEAQALPADDVRARRVKIYFSGVCRRARLDD